MLGIAQTPGPTHILSLKPSGPRVAGETSMSITGAVTTTTATRPLIPPSASATSYGATRPPRVPLATRSVGTILKQIKPAPRLRARQLIAAPFRLTSRDMSLRPRPSTRDVPPEPDVQQEPERGSALILPETPRFPGRTISAETSPARDRLGHKWVARRTAPIQDTPPSRPVERQAVPAPPDAVPKLQVVAVRRGRGLT